jgi:hypothetical protein
MLTCDNCTQTAIYTCADPGLSPINYCADCLPVWLHSRAEAGHFPLAVVEAPVEETPAPKTKKKAAPSDENN